MAVGAPTALTALVALCCLAGIHFQTTTALNLDWIPADPDGPLPASREFRDKLMELCITLRKAPAFFDSISDDKRNIIRSMCRRLQNAERAEREAYDYSHEQQPASKLWFLVLIVGIGTVWYYRIKDGSPIQSYWSRRRKTVW